MGVFALWSSAVALLVAGVASQGTAIAPAGGVNAAQQVAPLLNAATQAATAIAAVAAPGAMPGAPGAAPAAPGTPYAPVAGSQAAALPAGATTFDPMTAMTPTQPQGQPAVSTALRDAIEGNTAGLSAVAPAAIQQAPEATGAWVEGFVLGFFEKVTLKAGEKTCIVNNIHSISRDTVSILEEVGKVIADLVAHTTPEALPMMSSAAQVVELVTTTETLIKGCVQADALAVMNQTLKHLKNPEYVQGRLLANGIDIARVIADSIPAWQHSDFQKVGVDFGTLLRKILLSRNSGPAQMVLPNGMDKTLVYQNVVDGVIKGLFVAGTSLNITDALDPTVNIFVDLHLCIAEEAPFFSMALQSAYLAIAEISTSIEQMQLGQQGIQTGMIGMGGGGTTIGQGAVQAQQVNMNGNAMGGAGMQGQWMNKLSGILTNIPTLMDRCGLTEAQREMMSEAIKNLNQVGLAFNIPGPQDRMQAGDEAATRVEAATTAWKLGHYTQFGFLLGGLMRDLLLVIYPQKYSVEDGTLRRYVDSKKTSLVSNNTAASSTALMVAGFSAFMLVGLSVFRMGRPSRSTSPLLEADDMEAPDTAVE